MYYYQVTLVMAAVPTTTALVKQKERAIESERQTHTQRERERIENARLIAFETETFSHTIQCMVGIFEQGELKLIRHIVLQLVCLCVRECV